jgi:uncharacterized membrane protein
VIAFVGLALEPARGFGLHAVVAGVCTVTLGATAVAWVRRRRSEADPESGPNSVPRLARAIGGGSALSITLTVLVVATSVGAVGVVITEPARDPTVTELYVLGERPDGTLSAGAYPTDLTVGEPAAYVVGVGRSGDALDGTVVARLETVGPDGAVQSGQSTTDGRFPVDLGADESTRIEHTITPETTGERRLTYRLYRGDPDSGRIVRTVHVWVSVSEPPA